MKRFKILIITLFMLLSTVFVFGCANPDNKDPKKGLNPSFDELTIEQVEAIKQEYFNTRNVQGTFPDTDVDNVKILNHLGTYDNKIVVSLNFLPDGYGVACVTKPIRLGDYFIVEFPYPTYEIIVFYPDKSIKTLYEAYYKGEISEDELRSIAITMYNNYSNIPSEEGRLLWYEVGNAECAFDYYWGDDFSFLSGHVATYNKTLIFSMYAGEPYTEDLIVGGVNICTKNKSTKKYMAYVNYGEYCEKGECLTIKEAYEQGYLTKDNLYDLAEKLK